uniref:tRNA (cytosine(72)-C(5))-methyltransferase n=1 Tax=Ignisphaera aggregans TaxID=334771 RepID=A0A7J2U028_9CREN
MKECSELLHYDSTLLKALERIYGKDVDSFLNSILSPGSRLYIRVNTLRTSAETIIDRFNERGVEVYVDEELEEALYFPVKGPFKVNLVDKVIVVDKRAAESIYMGANVYAPGVLECKDVRKGNEATVVAEDGTPVANAIALVNCEEVLKADIRRGVVAETVNPVYKAPKIRESPEYLEGLIYPQSLAAMYVTHVLDPRPGELVVDACAAPGGKTSHIVEYSQGKAHVIAFDRSRRRLSEFLTNLERLRESQFVEVWRTDSRYLHLDFSWIRADKVVMDPPCTALGVRPKVLDSKTYRDVENASRYQAQLLRSAFHILKPGGVLVYSTCTVTVEENEEVIEGFVEEVRCAEVIEIDIKRGARGVLGYRYSDAFLRFHPNIHDTSGYFIAKIVRKC